MESGFKRNKLLAKHKVSKSVSLTSLTTPNIPEPNFTEITAIESIKED